VILHIAIIQNFKNNCCLWSKIKSSPNDSEIRCAENGISLRQRKKQEAQLMLTNPRDAFRAKSRTPNIVPFDISGMVSY